MIRAVSLCAALLLAAPASAGSFTQVVLLSNDTGVDVSKAQGELKKRLKLPGAVFVEPELPHELASALQHFPSDCSPKLSETIKSALDAASDDRGLFVALSTTDSHKQLAVWRWSVERQQIFRINKRGLDRPAFEKLDTDTQVVNLRWPETDLQQPADETVALLNRSNVDVVPSGLDSDTPLIDELMAHPNECSAKISSESVAMMKERAAERPGTDLFVNVYVPFRGEGDYLWRWSKTDETLLRVHRDF